MKLEVGMYVRYDYFGIGKIDKDYFDSNNKHWFNVQFNCYGDDDCRCGICEQSIGYKASHNIIDLIEVGDVLVDKEGHKYPINYEFETDYNNEYGSYEITIDDNITLFFKDDLSIVTKEQLEKIIKQMEYKVGE